MNPADLVARHLTDAEASFAIGTFGAIAEFHRAPEEPVVLSANAAVTRRGGIRLLLEGEVRAVAWERPAAGDGWTHGIALCLSAKHGAMSARTDLTELGPDSGALREEDRDAVLFDLGIGAPHCDFCVRTSDPEILRILRSATGRPALAAGLFGELGAMSPDRVITSRLGRVEVSTPIPAPRGRTPDGPHTHLLPDLLKHRRTHSATVPLPPGTVPGAEIFPPNAIRDEHGTPRPFNAARHDSFQKLFSVYGAPGSVEAKRDTVAAVRACKPPHDVPAYSRAQRLARRVALRQLRQTDGPSPSLEAWRKAFDSQPATSPK
jgi:hypothetical protein